MVRTAVRCDPGSDSHHAANRLACGAFSNSRASFDARLQQTARMRSTFETRSSVSNRDPAESSEITDATANASKLR
eukprot:2625106-Lingulodinium_polyedra.AAC.1